MSKFVPNVLQAYPNLTALAEKVKGKDSVKKYIENRPEDNWIMPQ